MNTCRIHGPYSGSKCFQCEVEESLERQKRAIEEAEDNAATRHWEAEIAADRRASQFAEKQQALVRDANKIRARALQVRACDLFNAQLFAEAIETCKDSLREDRGHLPAYATLAAALYEVGDLPAAAEAMQKAIRLTGHGEWTGPTPLSVLLSWLGQRNFPPPVVTALRETLRSYSGEADGALLRWIAARGWAEEVLQLLQRVRASCSDLIFMADWLIAKGESGAAGEVVSRAVGLADLETPEARAQWLKLVFLAIDLELAGEGDRLSGVLKRAEGWTDETGIVILRFLAFSEALKEHGEICHRVLLSTFADLAAHWLNATESRSIAEQLSKFPQTSGLLSWIPSVQQRSAEVRERVTQEAQAAFREEMLLLLRRSGFDRFLVAGSRWTVEASALAHAKARYQGEVTYRQGIRAEKRQEWRKALGAFTAARERYALAGDESNEAHALHELGWCTCPSNNPDGDWQRALDFFTQAVKLDESTSGRSMRAANLYWQAWCHEHLRGPQGDWASCVDLYRRAAEAGRIAELPDREGASLFRIGICSQKLRDWPTALDAFHRAREARLAAGNAVGALEALREIGWCTCPNNNEKGSWGDAYALFRGGEVLAVEAGASALIYSFVYWQGWCQEPVNNPQGDWSLCIDLYKKAAAGAHEVKIYSLEANSIHAVGFCYEPIHAPFGGWPTAAEWYRRAIPLWRKTGDRERLANSLMRLGKSLSHGDCTAVTSEAGELFREAAVLKQELGDEKGAAEAEEWARGGS